MKILAFQGKSLISKAIRWQTRSVYSHIGCMLEDGTVVEAWHKDGVQHVVSASVLHTPNTLVDVYHINAVDFDDDTAKRFLMDQVGKKYDFPSVARFMSRRKATLDDKWFCSELGEYASLYGGVRLLNGNPSAHAPGHTVMSPLLIHTSSFLTV